MKTLLLLFLSPTFLLANTDTLVTIYIHSNFENASIQVDDAETEFKTPAMIPGIKTGHHKITLSWYYLITGVEYVAEESIIVGQELDSFYIEFRPVTVGIVCNAQKTELYLNGRLQGEGSDIVLDSIIPGTYTMRIKQPFGIIAEKKVFFPPNSSDCPVECFVFGNLHVKSDELGNIPVFLNGKKTDQILPAVFLKLLVGEYEVSVQVKGKTFSKKIIVKAEEDVVLKINPREIEKEIRDEERSKALLRNEQKKFLAKKKKEEDLLYNSRKDQLKNIIDSNKLDNDNDISSDRTSKVKLSLYAGINYALYNSVSDGFGYNFGLSFSSPAYKSIQFRSDISFNTKNILCDNNYDKTSNIYYLDMSVLVKVAMNKRLHALAGLGYERKMIDVKIKYYWENGKNYYSKPFNNLYFFTIKLGYDLIENTFLEFSYTKNTSGLSKKLKREMSTYNVNFGYHFLRF